jgi:hypothetical protein
MTQRDLRWVGIDKTRLPRVLLGGDISEMEGIWSAEQAIHISGITVGFAAEELQGLNRATP